MDCIAGMKEYPDNYFQLAITDPPYGGNDAIGLKSDQKLKTHQAKRKYYKLFKNEAPDIEYFIELKRVSVNQIIWGVNFYNNFDLSGGRIVWDKNGTAFGRAEMAYYSNSKSVNIFNYTWNGMLQQNMKNKEVRIHPTQKPIALYEWLLMNYANEGDKILDTHLGSGSSRIAAYKLGFDFYGFELDKDHYKNANARFNELRPELDTIRNFEQQTKPEFKQMKLL